MADDDYGDETEREGDGIKSLRKQYETTRDELKAAREERDKLRAEQRTRTVEDVLKAKGYPASVAKLYTGADVSEDAVNSWLDEYKDAFATAGTAPDEPHTPSADEQAAARVAAASTSGPDATTSSMAAFGDMDEMQRLMETLPYEQLSERFPQIFPKEEKGRLYSM